MWILGKRKPSWKPGGPFYYLFQENKSFGTEHHLHSSSDVREVVSSTVGSPKDEPGGPSLATGDHFESIVH